MKPAQIKAKLFERNLNVSKMARELATEYPEAEFEALRVMIGDTLFGRRYYLRLAKLIKKKYGIEADRPVKNTCPRCQVKVAA
jgi:hypothetical protein